MCKISRFPSFLAATLLIFIANPTAPVAAPYSLQESRAEEDHASFPITPFRVVAAFDPPEVDWQPGHRGIDLAGQIGQEVHAPAAGEVHFAGMVANRPVVTLRLDNGDLVSMEPVSAQLSKGSSVQAGEVIGTITSHTSHCEPETCLHVGLRRNGQYRNPLQLWPNQRPPIVLLPPITD